MNRPLFHPQVGDRVRIRSWDDMEAEFGLTEYGSIACDSSFIDDMREIEGLEFTITSRDGLLYLGHGTRWSISKDMLEPCEDEEELENVDMEELNAFLDTIKIVK